MRIDICNEKHDEFAADQKISEDESKIEGVQHASELLNMLLEGAT